MEQEDLRTDLEGKNPAWPLITENNFTLSPRKNAAFCQHILLFPVDPRSIRLPVAKIKEIETLAKVAFSASKNEAEGTQPYKSSTPRPQAKSRFTYFVNALLANTNFTISQYF